MTLRRDVFQHADIGGPCAGLGARAAGNLHPIEQQFAQLLGRADIEFAAGEFVDVLFQRHLLLGEFVGEFAQEILIDQNSLTLHVRQHGNEPPLESLVNRDLAFGDETWLQQAMQAVGHIRIFGGIFRGLIDGYAVEGDLLLALAGDVRKRDRLVVQVDLGQLVHTVTVQHAVQHKGDGERIVERRNADAALQEDEKIVFYVLADLEDGIVFEKRLQALENLRFGKLRDDALVAGKIQAVAGAMAAGNITGFARRDGERDTA